MASYALLSVSNREGIVEFARGLRECGLEILASGGTAAFLGQHGVPVVAIEEYTKQPEILHGRVKTLHPKIHGGILAKRCDSGDARDLTTHGIAPIDVVVVNLYPFSEGLRSDSRARPEAMVELIDVGGPTMLRAAAKNFRDLLAVCDPYDYPRVLQALRVAGKAGATPLALRHDLALKVFAHTAAYDGLIAEYLADCDATDSETLKSTVTHDVAAQFHFLPLRRQQALRYGENPHQHAALYTLGGESVRWQQLQGKELSYNNLLDLDAAYRLARSLSTTEPTVAIIKHGNPCGVASGATLVEALHKAKRCDPRSHFGGILAFNSPVGRAVAELVREDFAEVVLAPHIDEQARTVFAGAKNLRVVLIPWDIPLPAREVRSVLGSVLVQDADIVSGDIRGFDVASARQPTDAEWRDLAFAWQVAAYVRSNAVTLVSDRMLVGVGAGQMSRIDSAEVALMKARTHQHDLKGAVAASDGFFPFPDSVETLAGAGVSAIIAPRGSVRDAETLAAANRAGAALIFAPERHFRH